VTNNFVVVTLRAIAIPLGGFSVTLGFEQLHRVVQVWHRFSNWQHPTGLLVHG
jgi:hypothetical protein